MKEENDVELPIMIDDDSHGVGLPKVTQGNAEKLSRPLGKKILARREKTASSEEEDVELPIMTSGARRKTFVVEESEKIVRPVEPEEKPVEKKEKSEQSSQKIQPKPRKKKGNFMLWIVVIAFVFVAVYCATKVNLWENDNSASEEQMANVRELIVERVIEPEESEVPSTNEPDVSDGTVLREPDYSKLALVDVDFSKLKKVNSDTVAYMKINGLDVSAPVVQTTNNDYYLEHSFDKSVNSAGWIFGDFRDDWDNLKKNTIVYGHNRRNYAMFGSLKLILEEKWYANKENHMIYVSTDKANMVFQIFSAYITPTETYYLANEFDSDEEYREFLDTLASRSQVDFGTKVTSEDKILTLSTCHTNTSKMVVHAKLVKVQAKS